MSLNTLLRSDPRLARAPGVAISFCLFEDLQAEPVRADLPRLPQPRAADRLAERLIVLLYFREQICSLLWSRA